MSTQTGATLTALRRRAALVASIRAFFAERGVLEVETPALSPAGVSDLALDSIVAHARALGTAPHYLQTSPEYAMKRLLAAGSGDIYQMCRVYRDDELGRWHQPEFTLLEWYRVGWDDHRLMAEVEELLLAVLRIAAALAPADTTAPLRDAPLRPAIRLSYAAAFAQHFGVDASANATRIAARLAELGIDMPAGLTHGALLDLAFSTAVAPRFARDALTFVYDYPASQAALAQLRPTSPPVAARFEVFAGAIELANGFHELTDAVEQRRRFTVELDERRRSGRTVAPLDEAFLAAVAKLPPCAGVALGIDRLVALALGTDGIAATLSFAHERD